MAMKCMKSTPYTNVPIHCTLCPPSLSGQPHTIWKYNDIYHLAKYHADWGSSSDNLTLPRIPGQLLVNSFITLEEENLMGIDEILTEDWRDENQILDTDRIEEMQEELKQARAESSVSVTGHGQQSQQR